MICTNCGNKLNKGARFCPKCGAPCKSIPEPKTNEKWSMDARGKHILLCCAGILGTVLLSVGVCRGLEYALDKISVQEVTRNKELTQKQNSLQQEKSELEDTIRSAQTRKEQAQKRLAELEQKLQEIDGDSEEDKQAQIEHLKDLRQQSLPDFQDWIVYIFDQYYELGVQYHVYEQDDLKDLLKEDVISSVMGGTETASGAATALIDGIVQGQSIGEIKDNILENGAGWVSQDVTSYIGEKLLGSSLMSILGMASSMSGDNQQLLYLVQNLENSIQNDYFACFYEALALEEWDDEVYYRCRRKASELQFLLEQIEEYTQEEAGSDVWRTFYDVVDSCGILYHGADALLQVYGEE